jgi:hypothetical protein
MNKKYLQNRFIVLTLFALISGATHVVFAQALPFIGSSENQAISAVPLDEEHVFVTTIGSGHATHLGKFTFVSPLVFDMASLHSTAKIKGIIQYAGK